MRWEETACELQSCEMMRYHSCLAPHLHPGNETAPTSREGRATPSTYGTANGWVVKIWNKESRNDCRGKADCVAFFPDAAPTRSCAGWTAAKPTLILRGTPRTWEHIQYITKKKYTQKRKKQNVSAPSSMNILHQNKSYYDGIAYHHNNRNSHFDYRV